MELSPREWGSKEEELGGEERQPCHIEQLKFHQPIAPKSYKKEILSFQLEASTQDGESGKTRDIFLFFLLSTAASYKNIRHRGYLVPQIEDFKVASVGENWWDITLGCNDAQQNESLNIRPFPEINCGGAATRTHRICTSALRYVKWLFREVNDSPNQLRAEGRESKVL